MSASEQSQVLQLAVDEALILRGAINVLTEIADRPIDANVGVPLNGQRRPVFEALLDQLRRRIEQATPGGRFQSVFNPAEAQAVRDAAQVLAALLDQQTGREVLAEVGFLSRPNAPVEQDELAILQDIASRIDPTGVREPVEEPRRLQTPNKITELVAPHPKFPRRRNRVDQLRNELSQIQPIRTEDDLDAAIDALLPHSASNCEDVLVALAELTQVSFQVVIGRGDVPMRRFNAMIRTVDEIRRELMDVLGFRAAAPRSSLPITVDSPCLDQDTLRGLKDSFLSMIDPIESEPDDPATRASTALSDIQAAIADLD